MTKSRINVSRNPNGMWTVRVDGTGVAHFLQNNNADDVIVEALILSAQHLAGHYESKSIDFTLSPDNMETIKRVGMKKPKLIKMVH